MKERNAPSEELTVSEHITVRFHEVDSLGIVWHGHYIGYFEEGREAFGRAHGISYLDAKANNVATPIVKSSCEHLLPLKYGETFRIETTFVNSPSGKMIFRYKIFNSEGELACTGETIQVFTDFDGKLSLYSPDFFTEWKQKMGLL